MRLTASQLCIDRGGRRILSDVSFCLDAGALLVTGENGAGKSSLLRVLAGFLPPASGRVIIEGAEGLETPLHYLGHRDGLKPALTVRENLVFAADFLGSGESALEPPEALAAFDLVNAAEKPVAWLSTGQRRRAALSQLLVAPRPLWLLDEPTTGLDTASVARFELIAADHIARGGLIVAATHAALQFATQELRLGAVDAVI